MNDWHKLLILLLFFIVFDKMDSIETHAKIVGGYPISIEIVPFQVSIRVRFFEEVEFGTGHLCGGTVISQRVICTAAHCFADNATYPPEYRDPENFIVVAGSSRIHTLNRFSEVYLVQQIIGHERYHPYTLENDIALVLLNSFIPYNHKVIRTLSPASLATPAGTFCYISGWGNANRELQQAIVPIQDQRLCSFIYVNLPRSQICAGYLRGGVDACKGDSGGPLVCAGQLTGIISWGIDCGKVFFPGVYTNISHFIKWIKQANSSLDYKRYLDMRSLNGAMTKSLPTLELYVVHSALLLIYLSICAD